MSSRSPDFSAGLIPAVVQSGIDGRVRMVGMMNDEAWDATESTGFVHFWSRSRNELWKKGVTSGNTLAVQSISVDCDGDAILIVAEPAGPTCHTGQESCFDDVGTETLGQAVDALVRVVQSRRNASTDSSYTATLLADPDLAARKVLEEAGEVAFASKDYTTESGDNRIVEESADLLYHLVALIEGRGVEPTTVARELAARRG